MVEAITHFKMYRGAYSIPPDVAILVGAVSALELY